MKQPLILGVIAIAAGAGCTKLGCMGPAGTDPSVQPHGLECTASPIPNAAACVGNSGTLNEDAKGDGVKHRHLKGHTGSRW